MFVTVDFDRHFPARDPHHGITQKLFSGFVLLVVFIEHLNGRISDCTDSLYSDDWRYYWQVNMPAATQITEMTAISNCTDSLRMWGDTIAECVLTKLAPSHTYVIFKYPE